MGGGPVLAAIDGKSRGATRIVWLQVVTPDDYPLFYAPKVEREDASRGCGALDRRMRITEIYPRLAALLGDRIDCPSAVCALEKELRRLRGFI